MTSKVIIGIVAILAVVVLYAVTRRPPAATYVDVDALREDLYSKNPAPEYRKDTEPYLLELEQKFGKQIPVSELNKFLASKQDQLKMQMKGYVEKAGAEGKTIELEALRQSLEKAKADYKGNDREAYDKEMDKFIASLRAQYGDRIPVVEAFKILQKLERDTGQTDSVDQFPLK